MQTGKHARSRDGAGLTGPQNQMTSKVPFPRRQEPQESSGALSVCSVRPALSRHSCHPRLAPNSRPLALAPLVWGLSKGPGAEYVQPQGYIRNPSRRKTISGAQYRGRRGSGWPVSPDQGPARQMPRRGPSHSPWHLQSWEVSHIPPAMFSPVPITTQEPVQECRLHSSQRSRRWTLHPA